MLRHISDDWHLGAVSSIAVDRRKRVYVFSGGAHPMIVFDGDGNCLFSWDQGLFVGPHAPRKVARVPPAKGAPA